MKIIKIENCFDCPYYDNMSGPGEGQYGLCLKALDRYRGLPPKFFEDVLINNHIPKEHRALVHDPCDIPEWCPLENV